MKLNKNAHCSYCGVPFVVGQSWPRQCAGCENLSFLNPIPVAACLLPVDGGLLVIRRAIPPAVGELALPGGYIDASETWQQAVARELREETGIRVDASEIRHFGTHSSLIGDGVMLIFGIAPSRTAAELPPFAPEDTDASEMLVIKEKQKLAFPLHNLAVEEYFDKCAGTS